MATGGLNEPGAVRVPPQYADHPTTPQASKPTTRQASKPTTSQAAGLSGKAASPAIAEPAEPVITPAAPGVHAVQRLQSAAGNAAVAGMLATAHGPAARPTTVQPTVQPMVQRRTAAETIEAHDGVLGLDEDELGEELAAGLPGNGSLVLQVLDQLSSGDRDDVALALIGALPDDRLATVSTEVRIRCVRELVGGFVGDDEEGQISRIWLSFGDQLPAVAAAESRLWSRSIDESDQLNDSARIQAIRLAFGGDVVALARHFLQGNADTVVDEGARLGLDLLGGRTMAPPEPGYLEAMQRAGATVLRLQGYEERLRRLQVGYTLFRDPEIRRTYELPATFHPEGPPERGPHGDESPQLPAWQDVKTQHDRVTAAVQAFTDEFPSLYVLLQRGGLAGFTQASDAAHASNLVAQALTRQLATIREADTKVATGDIAWYDLIPVHSRLLATADLAAGFRPQHPWSEPFYGSLARDVLDDQESRDFWTSLGLTLVGAAAIIAAPFTGGASAAALVGLGIGIGAGQAAASWERYLDLAVAAEATVRDEFAIISESQVSAALLTAVMDTVGVFLDAYGAGAASAAQRATRRAALEVAERGMREQLEAAARSRLVRDAAFDAAVTTAGAGVAVAQHELADDDAQLEVQGETVDLEPEAEDATTSVSLLSVQRMTGEEFEQHVHGLLKRGAVPGIPELDILVPGQYTGSGWGIDRIGIRIHDSGRVSIFHFEMKFRSPPTPTAPGVPPMPASPTLGQPSVGTQTGRAWTERAVTGFLESSSPEARAARRRLKRALRTRFPGQLIDDAWLSRFLRRRLVNARVRIVVPVYVHLGELGRQLGGLIRQGRRAAALRVPVP